MNHLRVYFIAVIGLAAICALTNSALAENDYVFGEPKHGFSFSPAPGSVCSSFLVTEMSLMYRVKRADSKPSLYEFTPSQSNSYMVNWQLGYMGNTSGHDSWGVVLNLALGDDRYRLGGGPAYRRWFGHRSFVDASAGIFLAATEDDFDAQGTPLYAQVGVGIASIFSVVGRIERLSFEQSRVYSTAGPYSPTEWKATFYHLGINVGGKPGAVLCAVSAAALLVAIISMPHERVSEVPVRY
jgi:hypothetical protein